MPPTIPLPSPLSARFGVDPSLVYLNPASFGLVPLEVLEFQNEIRRRQELDSVRFFATQLEGLLDEARAACCEFLGADPASFAFVHNATAGVNTVVRSLDLRPGDELLIGNQEYNACNNACRYAAARAGASCVELNAPFPLSGPNEYESALLGAITPRTKLVLLSHVTSPTGLVLPVERLIPRIQSMGVDVLLDTAHGPGMLPLNLRALDPAYCTGNFHKWTGAPKGSAFLTVRADKRDRIHPLIISHGYNVPRTDRPRFRLEFDYVGSIDYSPWLSTPKAIEVSGSLVPGGWPAIQKHNNELCRLGRDTLCAALDVPPPAPDAMLASLASIVLPAHEPDRQARLDARPTKFLDPLWDVLLDKWRIVVPIFRLNLGGRDVRICRIAAHVINTPEQYRYLAQALTQELALERRL